MGDRKARKVSDFLDCVEITPLKDFHIKHNVWDIPIIKDVPVSIPTLFLINMKTEGVITDLPKN